MRQPNILLVSSTGGHFEQIKKLQPLLDKYGGVLVTEKSSVDNKADHYMHMTDLKDKLMIFKMLFNTIIAFKIWFKEKPDYIITTGTMVAYPFYLLSIIFKKKFIFIETFGRADEPTVAGKMMEKHSDLFFVQWESMKKYYSKAIFKGVLY
ncbi:PssD/Cps14F family polysaccharide biosynthesis glycosyltransferase [Enterococcus lemanii]|uniref:PssD/Cps14F family polysaccharide biosynthesis glycosyltransferase n=1 Tax=Enterococcus lemanii TaxID=1159752 RepID=A0ABV9MUR4_9ENTE|nr:PssD/Cps14F family polysaccharide biosynthesis glycosyltransferase [Enterococcus lemanii]MBM7710027.1 UDP-N-acetylglucosamine:LPS N-acetylglucosamine transferase [Enterococcus lemanii]